jgi:hypothetical protein
MPVTLEDVGDESDYELDQRKIFVQNFQLKVAGYIINEDDIVFEENIVRILLDAKVDVNKGGLEYIVFDDSIVIDFPYKSKTFIIFKSNADYDISSVNVQNALSHKVIINNLTVGDNFSIKKYDRVMVSIQRDDSNLPSKITLMRQ